MKLIIALTGYSKSGANTIASYMAELLNSKGMFTEVISMDHNLHSIVADILDISLEELMELKEDNTLLTIDNVLTNTVEFIDRVGRTVTKHISKEAITHSVLKAIADSNNAIFIIPDVKTIVAAEILKGSGHMVRFVHIESTIDKCFKDPMVDFEANAIGYDHIIRNRENTELYKMDVGAMLYAENILK